jgi:hypothetical protein
MDESSEVLEWTAPEYEPIDRSPDWFWAAGVIIFAILIICIVLKNFLLALIILIGTSTLFVFARRDPEMITFRLLDNGIQAKNEIFLYKHIESFWVSEDRYPHKLFIKTDRLFFPHIVIPLDDADPVTVRTRIKKNVKEVPHEESMIELLSEYLGF